MGRDFLLKYTNGYTKSFLRWGLIFSYLLAYQCSALDSTSSKRVNYSGIALPSRSPENGYYIQGGLVGVFKTTLKDSSTRASNIYLYALYSQLHQWRISLGGSIFTPSEKYFVNFWYYGSYLPEKYFGIGENTNPNRNEFISYHVFHTETFFLRKLSKNNFLGLIHYLERMGDIVYPIQGIMDQNRPSGITSNFCNGLGLSFRHDSRDYLLSSKRGVYTELSMVRFGKFLGSDYAFTLYRADLRKFWQVIPNKDHIFAVQSLFTACEGAHPLRWLPNIYSRGYHPNLYRNNLVYMLQAEYRLRVWKWFGASFFGGMSQSADKITTFSESPIRPNYGMGLRFKLMAKHNLQLRIDYGFGQGTSNYYLAFYDAF